MKFEVCVFVCSFTVTGFRGWWHSQMCMHSFAQMSQGVLVHAQCLHLSRIAKGLDIGCVHWVLMWCTFISDIFHWHLQTIHLSTHLQLQMWRTTVVSWHGLDAIVCGKWQHPWPWLWWVMRWLNVVCTHLHKQVVISHVLKHKWASPSMCHLHSSTQNCVFMRSIELADTQKMCQWWEQSHLGGDSCD